MNIMWWEALGFFVCGASAGGAIVYLALNERAEQKAQDLMDLKLRRELYDNGRSYPARPDAGPSARVHRARYRKRSGKPSQR